MAAANQQAKDPEHAARMAAGKAGKLFRIEVLYFEDQAVKKVEICNRYWEEVKGFRMDVYDIGVMLPIHPGKWRVVSPADIKDIYVYRQNGYL